MYYGQAKLQSVKTKPNPINVANLQFSISRTGLSASVSVAPTKTINFQFVEKQYLDALENHAREHQLKIDMIRKKMYSSVLMIQAFWQRYIYRKKLRKVMLLQKWWRKVSKHLRYRKEVLSRVKQTIRSIKLRYFLRKYVCKRLGRPVPALQKTQPILDSKKVIVPLLGRALLLDVSLQTEMRYMMGLKQYNKTNFNKSWEKYEKDLLHFLMTQTQRKWVAQKITYYDKAKGKQVTKIKWLDEKGKQRDREAYIQRELERIYEEKFEKYEAVQEQVHRGIVNLERVQEHYRQKYEEAVRERSLASIKREQFSANKKTCTRDTISAHKKL